MDISVKDDPNFKGEISILEKNFLANPQEHLAKVKRGYQLIIVDNQGNTLLVSGAGKLNIEITDLEGEGE